MTPSPRGSAAVDCVIVHYGDPGPSIRLGQAVSARPDTRVWLVDNADNLGDVDPAAGQRLRPGTNLGFGAAVNLGAGRGSAPWVLVLNPDVWMTRRVLDALLVVLEGDDTLALVAPRLLYPDGSAQLNGGRYSGWLVEAARVTGHGYLLRGLRARLRRETTGLGGPVLIRRPWVSGAAMLMRREAFRRVGGFDPGFFLYFEDEDLCRRLRRDGWEVAVASNVCVEHAVGGTSGEHGPYRSPAYEASRRRYHDRHSGRLLRRLVAQTSRRRPAGRIGS